MAENGTLRRSARQEAHFVESPVRQQIWCLVYADSIVAPSRDYVEIPQSLTITRCTPERSRVAARG